MGSEMCIRDRDDREGGFDEVDVDRLGVRRAVSDDGRDDAHQRGCLLYTSDAADERSSVDLGGRRIIKKKKQDLAYVSTLL